MWQNIPTLTNKIYRTIYRDWKYGIRYIKGDIYCIANNILISESRHKIALLSYYLQTRNKRNNEKKTNIIIINNVKIRIHKHRCIYTQSNINAQIDNNITTRTGLQNDRYNKHISMGCNRNRWWTRGL